MSVFCTAVGYFKSRTRDFDIVKMKGFIKDGRLVNVHLSSGLICRRVRFVGFSAQSSTKGGVPSQLSQMVVFETVNGARVFFRPDAVRIIEENEDVG